MNKKLQRFLSILCALAMLLSCMPAGVLAENAAAAGTAAEGPALENGAPEKAEENKEEAPELVPDLEMNLDEPLDLALKEGERKIVRLMVQQRGFLQVTAESTDLGPTSGKALTVTLFRQDRPGVRFGMQNAKDGKLEGNWEVFAGAYLLVFECEKDDAFKVTAAMKTPEEPAAQEPEQQIEGEPGKEPEQKIEGEPEKEPEQKIEGEPEKEPEQKIEGEPEKEPEQKIEGEPEKEPEQKIEGEPEKEPEQKIEGEPEKEPEQKIEGEPEKEPEQQIEGEPEKEPEQKIEGEPEKEPEQKIEGEPEKEPEQKIEGEPEKEPEQQIEGEPEKEPEQKIEGEPEKEPEQKIEGEPEKEPEQKIEGEPEKEPEQKIEGEPEKEPEQKIEGEPEKEPEQKIEGEPEQKIEGEPEKEPEQQIGGEPEKEPEQKIEGEPEKEPEQKKGEPEKEPEQKIEGEPEKEPEQKIEGEPEKEPEQKIEGEPEKEPEQKIEGEPEKEPEQKIEGEPEQKIEGEPEKEPEQKIEGEPEKEPEQKKGEPEKEPEQKKGEPEKEPEQKIEGEPEKEPEQKIEGEPEKEPEQKTEDGQDAEKAKETVTLLESDVRVEALSQDETDALVARYLTAPAKAAGAKGGRQMLRATVSADRKNEAYAAFDIILDNAEMQDYGGYRVPVQLDSAIDLTGARAAAGEKDVFTVKNVVYTLYHIHENEKGETVVDVIPAEAFTAQDKDGYLTGFTFETDGFSTYVLKYTVDFHYDGVDYSIEGGSQILLSDLIAQMQIMNGDALLDVMDVKEVTFTNRHLVKVEQVSGLIVYNGAASVDVGEKDFLLTSEMPFSTDEALTITLTDGQPIVLNVTDAAYWIYLEKGQKEFALKPYFLAQSNLGADVYDYAISCSIYFRTSSGDYVYDYSYTNDSNGFTVTKLNNIPAGDYMYIGFYDWDASSWVKDQAGTTLWLCFVAPEAVTCSDGVFTYAVDEEEKTALITGLDENYSGDGNLVIPATVEYGEGEFTVVGIAASAFDSDNDDSKPDNIKSGVIRSVTFSNTAALTIGNYAFYGCKNLARVGGDGPIASLGQQVFSYDDSLATITLTGSDLRTSAYMFYYCGALESFTLNGTVYSSLGSRSFEGCTSLKTVTINAPMDTIDAHEFEGCSALETVTIALDDGDSLAVLPNAFNGCVKLHSVIKNRQQIFTNENDYTQYFTVAASEAGAPIGAQLAIEAATVSAAAQAAVEQAAQEALAPEEIGVGYVKISLLAPDGTECANADAQIQAYQYPGVSYAGLVENAKCRVYPISGDTVGTWTDTIKPVVSGKEIVSETLVNAKQGTYAIAYQADSTLYHDDMFYYELDDTDPQNIVAKITGIYSKYTGTILRFTGRTRNEDAYLVPTVPDGVFSNNSKITAIIFSNKDEITVQGKAFQSMTALQTIHFGGEGLVSFVGNDWDRPVGYCTALTTVTGTGPVSFNAMGIFEGCSSLTNVKLGAVKKINQNTFIDNNALYSFEAESIEEIGLQGFNRCTGLKSFRVNGNVGTIGEWAFDGCKAMETFIVMGTVDTMLGSAVNTDKMRVAVFKGGVKKISAWAFRGEPFGQDNNLIYVGGVGGSNTMDCYAFGGSDYRGNAYFNVTSAALKTALGKSSAYDLHVDLLHCSDQDKSADMYVSENGYSYDLGTQEEPCTSFTTAMAIMYNRMDDMERFDRVCAAAGVADLGLVFYGDMEAGFDGFVLHVVKGGRNQDVTAVAFPEDLYGNYVSTHSYITNAPSTFSYLKAVIFEDGMTEIGIPDGAMQNFPNLASVEVKNADAVVTIGVEAFKGTGVNTVCEAKQIVYSRDGVVTIEKGANAPIGTALAIEDADGDRDAVIQAARAEGLFEDSSDADIQVRYFDISLVSPQNEKVKNVPAKVTAVQKLAVYTGADTIAPNAFAFFHMEDAATLATKEFAADQSAGTITFSFAADGFSPYAAAYTTDIKTVEGFYTYLVDGDGNATITGYGPDFSGSALDIPDVTEEIDGKTYKVVGIAKDALKNPPEGITITSVRFNNSDPIMVGGGAMSGIATIETIEFAGAGKVEIQDASVFADSGAETVAVNMKNGLTAQTSNGKYGDVFSGLNGLYTLTLGESLEDPISIPAEAFKTDQKLQAVTVACGLADQAKFKPTYSNADRGDYTNSAVNTGAFDGCSNLESFIVEKGEGDFSIGNEAFQDCEKLATLSYTGNLRGLGENALKNTGFTSLTLKGSKMGFGRESLAYCKNLKYLEIDGDVYNQGSQFLGGDGENATMLETLVFDGYVSCQLFDETIRGERLKVLVFKKGCYGMTDGCICAEGQVTADSLNVYVGHEDEDDDPSFYRGAFPAGQKNVRVYLNLALTREEADADYWLNQSDNVVDVLFYLDTAPTEFYVDADVGENDVQNGSRNQPYCSMERAKAAADATYDHSRFVQYFRDAGYDPEENGLEIAEGSGRVTEFALHLVGGTDEADDSFAGDMRMTSLEINTDGAIAVDSGAFRGCTGLQSITMEDMKNPVGIGESAFEGCTALENMTIGYYSTYYAAYNAAPSVDFGPAAFKGCTALAEIDIDNAKDLTFGVGAFENCAKIESVEIPRADSVTFKADAFKNTGLQKVDVTASKNVAFEENALKGLETLSAVSVTAVDAAIGSGAFADCGTVDQVLLMSSNAPAVKSGAFNGPIGVLRVDGGCFSAEEGAFSGGTAYIDGSETFEDSLAARIGGFENVILTTPQTISADAQVFSGNDALLRVYLGRDVSTDGGAAGAIFAGMPDGAAAYVARKQADFTDENRPTRTGGALRFLDNDGFLYIDGTNNNPEPDGSESNGFKTFAQAKAYVSEHKNASNAAGSSEYYYSDLADAVRTACKAAGVSIDEKDIRFLVPDSNSNVFYVIGTVTVAGEETWKSDEDAPITLVRGDQFTGAMAIVPRGASLTLENVVLDGLNYPAKGSLVEVRGGEAILNDGAVLQNNYKATATDNFWKYGGGLMIDNGSAVMNEGSVIRNNQALYGGGVLVAYGSFTMNGGTVADNTAENNDKYIAQGGGVFLGPNGSMTMAGGLITGNRAIGAGPGGGVTGAVGGGIKVGWGFTNGGLANLTMTGGTISENEASAEGGGMDIEGGSVATVTGGSIIGNKSGGGAFGGGGVYVNGARDGGSSPNNGLLILKNVLITDNTAREEGGGLAGCTTSSSSVYCLEGGAIYGNHAFYDSDVYVDVISRPIPGRQDNIVTVSTMKAYVTQYMFNGSPYNWTDSRTGDKLSPAQLSDLHNLIRDSFAALTANPDGTEPTAKTASVIISGNVSSTKGGGIGSNGDVIIGGRPEPQEISWTPEADKVLHDRDMKTGEHFDFLVYEEKETTGDPSFWWSTYTDELIGAVTGTVTGAKSDENKAIVFSGSIPFGEVNVEDIGSTRTFLLVEKTPEGEDLLPVQKYLAFVVSVTTSWDKETEKEIFSADVLRVETGRLVNGEFEFDNVFDDDVYDSATAQHNFGRIRTVAEKAEIHNYSDETDISASKEWMYGESAAVPQNASVTFELYADGEATGKQIVLNGEADGDGEAEPWTASWKDLKVYRRNGDGQLIPDGDGYERIAYTVKEIGWTPACYQPVQNVLDATKSLPAAFVNEYRAEGEITLEGVKTLENREFQAGDKWTFTVTAAEGVPMPERTQVTIEPAEGSSAAIDFGKIQYTQKDIGKTYEYTVTESGTVQGVANDPKAQKLVQVTVTDKPEGKRDGELIVAYAETSEEIAFVNTYEPAGEITLEGVKTLENRQFQAGDKWTFTVTAAEGVPMPERTEVTIEPAEGSSAAIDFGKIQYTQKDIGKTYEYTVTESGTVQGVANDPKAQKLVQVTVTDKPEGERDGKLIVAYAETSEEIAFVNAYEAAGEIALEGVKTLENREFQAGDKWTFTVTAAEGVPMPERTEVTVEPAEGSSAAIDFGKIQYTEKDIGKTYEYTVTESGTVQGVANDPKAQKLVQVTVTDKPEGERDGELIVAYAETSEEIAFVNTYEAAGEITLEGVKTLENRQFQAGDKWTFTVTAAEGVPMPERTEVTVEPAEGSSAAIDFGKIQYTQKDIGKTYEYTVTESGTVQGVANDPKAQKLVQVTVTDKLEGERDGELIVSFAETSEEIAFVNTFELAGKTTLGGEKKMAGRAFKAGDAWTFRLEGSEGAPMPDVTEVTITPESGNRAAFSFGEILFKQSDDGKVFTYTITETAGSDPAVTMDTHAETVTVTVTDNKDGTITVKKAYDEDGVVFENVYETTRAEIVKVWNDGNNLYGLRPAGILVTLLGNGEKISDYILNAENNWTVKAEGLPRYKNGEEIAYTWTEEQDVREYEQTAVVTANAVTTLTNTLETGSLTIRKTFAGVDGVDAAVLNALTFTVTGPNGYKRTVTYGEFTNGQMTINQVPLGVYTVREENADGMVVTYTLRPDSKTEGQANVTKNANAAVELNNLYTAPKPITIRGAKTWIDGNNQDGKRPESITVSLYANGVLAARTKATEAKGWAWCFENLKAYDAAGNRIVYTVQEDPVEGYASVVTGYDITNIYVPESTVVEVVKIWDDENDLDGSRPESLEVRLLANGALAETVTLNAENEWHAAFADMPMYENGTPIQYTWEETETEGYTASVMAVGTLTIITNTHVPEVTEVTVRKVWNDKNNLIGMRPESLRVTLSNGETVYLNAENGWTATVEHLPVTYKGEAVEYTWSEQEAAGYVLTAKTEENGVTTFTNSLWERTPPPPGDKPRQPGKPVIEIPPYDTPLGLDGIVNHVGHCFD